jgi:hypothetical protein
MSLWSYLLDFLVSYRKEKQLSANRALTKAIDPSNLLKMLLIIAKISKKIKTSE